MATKAKVMVTVNTNGASAPVAVATVAPPVYFVGQYIEDMRDMAITALVTGWHGLIMGAPGWGKTDMLLSFLNTVYGKDGYCWLRVNEGLKPDKVEGSTDMNHLVQHSEFRLNPARTPYDTGYNAVLLDEAFRGNDLVYSLFIDLLDRKDLGRVMPVLATANFLPTGKKHEALLDRVSLWHWVTPGALDAKAVARVQAQRREGDPLPLVPGKLPTLAELDFCHNALPGPKALDAQDAAIDLLQAEMTKAGRLLHPRRITMFSKVLMRMSYYYTGSTNFDRVPDEAMAALRFAMPAFTEAEYRDWGSLITAIKDPIQAAVDKVRGEAAQVVNDVAAKAGATDEDKIGGIKKLMALDKSLKLLLDQNKGNATIQAASAEIRGWFDKVYAGERVERL